jgi:tetratricopeptide (TPR) repeat protein
MITVATSIPPVLSRRNAGRAIDGEYQTLCIRSLIANGFRVLSINHRDEIPALASRYPEVSFIETTRDASALSGRRTPYIADLLQALLTAPGPVTGIVNSDVVFEPSDAWRTWLPRAAADALVMGQRHDANSLADGTFRKYYWGFDFFFFARDLTRELLASAMPFAMGVAWWDYWLPAALALKGRQVLTLERPAIAHLIHKDPSLDDSWRELAIRFAEFITRESAHCQGLLPPAVRAVLPVCGELAQMPELRWRHRGADALIGQLAVQFIPWITRDVARVPAAIEGEPDSSSSEITLSNVFDRFDERLVAGEALERAKRRESEGRTAEASNDFRFALEQTPRDHDVLCTFGAFQLRHGDALGAADLFRKAIESDPDDGRTYCNLAVALHQSGQKAEAVSVLEKALTQRPEFTEASDLLHRLCS